jgi:hypothetical protein
MNLCSFLTSRKSELGVPAKNANRALSAPTLRHIVVSLDKKLHQTLEMMRRNGI